VSIGCYNSGNACKSDVFAETLGPTQSSNAAASYSLSSSSDACGYNKVISCSCITVDICLKICTQNGFKYASINIVK
jgi:hypothetical protein